MEIRVYVWIEDAQFSPKEFQSNLDQTLQGTIEHRKKIRDGVVEQTREHWKSRVIEAANHEEAITKLHELIAQLRPALLNIRDKKAMPVAQVVSHCNDSSEAHGFHLPLDTIDLLSEVGALLDIDQYYHSNDTD